MRHIGFCFLLLGIMLSSDPSFAQAPARAGQAAPPRAAAPAPVAAKPLNLEDLQKILASGNDAGNARAVAAAPLDVQLEEEWLTLMQKTIPLSSMPATYAALLARVPAGPALADVERDGPALLNQLRALVASANRQGIMDMAHPEVATEMATVLEMFDPSRGGKHVLGKFIDLPGTRKVGVPVYVLPSDAVEKFYFVVFTNIDGKLVIRDVRGGAEIAELRLTYEKDWAIAKLKDLFRDLNQNSDATAKAISTPGLHEDIAAIGGWKRLTRRQRLSPEEIQIKASVPLDQKSVRVVARVSYPTPGLVMAFDVDFERFGNELSAVRLRDTNGKDIAVDTNMDCEVLKRYQATGPCEYKTNYTDELPYLSINKLKDYAQKAIEDVRIADLSKYATELETSFTLDETKGLASGLRATVHFMNSDYAKVYEVGSSAIAAGGQVYFPLLHLGTGFFTTDPSQPLQKMTLGVSSTGLYYYPSYQSNKPETAVPVAAIKGFAMDKGSMLRKQDPYLVVKVSLPDPAKGGKVEDQTWNFMAYGSSCAPANPRPAPDQIVWTQSDPCSATRSFLGVPVPGSTQNTVALVPANWDKALEAVVRMYDISKSGVVPGGSPRVIR